MPDKIAAQDNPLPISGRETRGARTAMSARSWPRRTHFAGGLLQRDNRHRWKRADTAVRAPLSFGHLDGHGVKTCRGSPLYVDGGHLIVPAQDAGRWGPSFSCRKLDRRSRVRDGLAEAHLILSTRPGLELEADPWTNPALN